MRLARIMLSGLCWQLVGALIPFMRATLRGRSSLPRIVVGRLVLLLVDGLAAAGDRLAPEATRD